MKRWLISLMVLPVLMAGAAPADAGTPGIRSTREYQQLKVYVQELEAKKSQPQTAAQIQKYRSELSQKRSKASLKVRALYQDQLSKAKQRRDNRKAKVVRLKQRRNTALANLRQAEQARLNQIAADRRATLARINTQYTAKMDNLTKQRAKLEKKIAKAKNPIKRQNLQQEQRAVQSQINTLVKSKQDDIRIANNKYDDQVQTTKENYDQRIENTQSQYEQQITELQQNLRELYQQARQNAQQRRATEFADVKELYDRGVGYINEMQQQQ